MNKILTTVAAAVIACVSISASAQYTIIKNDNSRVEVYESNLTFENTDGENACIKAGSQSYPLSEIASLEYTDAASRPIVLAYHPYYSSKLPKTDIITHINYGFAEVYVKNGVYNKFKLQGSESAFRKVVDLKKKAPWIKILLSFSHTVVNSDNKQDGGFSAIAASDEYRKAFADDCLKFVEKWSIDGIDLDWEFPGLSWSGAACDPVNDVNNYTLLIKQLRETLGNKYLLTFAGYCMDKRTTSTGTKYIDLVAVEPYVDFVNVMTYDLDETPHFHNAISSSISYWDIERTIKAYRAAKFPMEKVVLGIPFYVRNTYGNALAYWKLNTLKEEDGYKIDNWDDKAKVPYVTLNGRVWGSYDNERSIGCKAEYAFEKGLRGLFYWCTYEDDADYTLSKAVWQAVQDNWY